MQPHEIIIKSPVSAGMLEVFRLLDATGPAFMPLSLCSKAPEVLPAPWQLRNLNSQLTSQLRSWMETKKIALFKNHLRAPHFDCQFVLLSSGCGSRSTTPTPQIGATLTASRRKRCARRTRVWAWANDHDSR